MEVLTHDTAFALLLAEAKALLRNAEYADGQALVLTQDCEALEHAVECARRFIEEAKIAMAATKATSPYLNQAPRTVAEYRAYLVDKATKIRNALAFNYCMDAGAKRYNSHLLAQIETRLADLGEEG